MNLILQSCICQFKIYSRWVRNPQNGCARITTTLTLFVLTQRVRCAITLRVYSIMAICILTRDVSDVSIQRSKDMDVHVYMILTYFTDEDTGVSF